MRLHTLLTSALVFLFSFDCFAQPEGFRIGPKSTWVENINYNKAARPSDAEAASSYYLLYDEQENTLTQEDFYHYAYTILTSEGIQEMSDLSVTFDPAYQQVTFHEIKIRRGDQIIDQLSKNISLIQREQSMDRYLYDGSKTAVINLRDIRVGDIIEYSFTRKGYNPVHQGHIARTFYFDVYQSVEHCFKRIILSPSKNYSFKDIGKVVAAEVVKTDKAIEYRWVMPKLKATDYDSNTPSWFENGTGVMISDFSSWKEVGDWGKKLFVISDADRKRIKEEVAPTLDASSDADYVLKAIRFVQDEVRYLGFESGINSHKPYPPMQVYEQRFGDCKDKSLLLTTLLQARGIDAYPMLVNTSWKQTLDDKLPAGNIFDHCVVQIDFEGKKIYIDPTMSSQGGTLEKYYFPSYKRGLIIDNDIDGLDVLPEPETPTTSEIQTFDLATIGGEAIFSVRTMYTGSSADYQRAEFARTPLETTQKNYREYYANLYPDIAHWEDLTFTDNRESNVFIVQEKYKIPSFWKPIENAEGKITCVLQPQSITQYFDIPKNIQQRTAPYYISYPVDFTHTITVKLPEPWNIQPIDKVISNDLYEYDYTVKIDGNELTRLTHYKTKSDHVPVEKLASFIEDHAVMYENLVYQLQYDTNIAAASEKNWIGIIVTILCVVAGSFLVLRLYNHYDPAPFRYMRHGSPIGGWLILVGIGAVFTPFRLIYDFSTNAQLLTGSSWLGFFAGKQYVLGGFLLFSQIYNVIFLMTSVLIIVLFFQRRSSFPRIMSIQLAVNAIMIIADSTATNLAGDNPSPSDFDQVIRPVIGALIWVPYLNMSMRVKETFVIRGPFHNDSEDSENESQPKVEEQISLS